jgi:hypothetical protein
MVNDHVVAEAYSERIALFRARVAVVFERLPMLCGFHVTEDLSVVEVAVHGWPGCGPTGELNGEICAALEDLVVDRAKDTVDLLRGRTFARAVH